MFSILPLFLLWSVFDGYNDFGSLGGAWPGMEGGRGGLAANCVGGLDFAFFRGHVDGLYIDVWDQLSCGGRFILAWWMDLQDKTGPAQAMRDLTSYLPQSDEW